MVIFFIVAPFNNENLKTFRYFDGNLEKKQRLCATTLKKAQTSYFDDLEKSKTPQKGLIPYGLGRSQIND